MSVKVYKGLALSCASKDKKTGTSNNGKFYCGFPARSETDAKSKDSVMVWASNPEEAQFFTSAKVGNIIDVTKSARKREDGTWETRVSVTAHIDGINERAVRDRDTYNAFAEQVNAAPEPTKDDFMDFTKAADFPEDGLPFN